MTLSLKKVLLTFCVLVLFGSLSGCTSVTIGCRSQHRPYPEDVNPCTRSDLFKQIAPFDGPDLTGVLEVTDIDRTQILEAWVNGHRLGLSEMCFQDGMDYGNQKITDRRYTFVPIRAPIFPELAKSRFRVRIITSSGTMEQDVKDVEHLDRDQIRVVQIHRTRKTAWETCCGSCFGPIAPDFGGLARARF